MSFASVAPRAHTKSHPSAHHGRRRHERHRPHPPARGGAPRGPPTRHHGRGVPQHLGLLRAIIGFKPHASRSIDHAGDRAGRREEGVGRRARQGKRARCRRAPVQLRGFRHPRLPHRRRSHRLPRPEDEDGRARRGALQGQDGGCPGRCRGRCRGRRRGGPSRPQRSNRLFKVQGGDGRSREGSRGQGRGQVRGPAAPAL